MPRDLGVSISVLKVSVLKVEYLGEQLCAKPG
jgi:hypothetical protein